MKFSRHFLRGLLDVAIILPLLFQFCLLAAVALAGAMQVDAKVGWGIFSCICAIFLSLCFRAGLDLARKFEGPDSVFSRYKPVIAAGSYTMVLGLIAIYLPVVEGRAVFEPFVSLFSMAHVTSSMLIALLLNITSVPSPWPYITVPLAIYLSYMAGIAWAFRERSAPRTSLISRISIATPFLAAFATIAWQAHTMRSTVLLAEGNPMFAERTIKEPYQPFKGSTRLVKIDEPGITISSNHPRLDGATAALPIYAAAAEAIYTGIDPQDTQFLINSSTTPEAYKRLIAKKVDIIFAAQPSPEQREAAGVTLHLTPIGKEAFVFFVHRDNPVNSITSEQIRGIYTKTFQNWSELGGANRRIAAFQRPAGSGSQTALEQKVMQGAKPFTPQREEYARGMGGIIQRVASYRNTDEAIGYSFRFFVTTMNSTKEIKLLEIDGVAPTRETIRSGAYPYTVDLFAITAGTTNPHASALVDWFLTPVGQKLIDDTGYVSLSPEAQNKH